MAAMLQGRLWRPSLAPGSAARFSRTVGYIRRAGYQPYDAAFDPEELSAARTWYKSFKRSSLPKGSTIYSRSSGPGGQHVNKTETKATTSWAVAELESSLPAMLHPRIRSSKYYNKRNDSVAIQAQAERSRSANTEANYQKLYEELVKLYQDAVPNESAAGKKEKWETAEKSFHQSRLTAKKAHSSKKQARRKGGLDD